MMAFGARVVSPQELKALLAQGLAERKPLSDAERAAVLAALENMDRLAIKIGEAWKGDMSAAEAVKEQRREL